MPPVIKPQFADGQDCRNRDRIAFRVSDNFSGIASYTATVDGRWVAIDLSRGRASIDLRAEGVDPYEAVVRAARSRLVPVCVASVTTILALIPLLFDSLFASMASTIMGGLLVATILTMVVLPVVYAIFYNIKKAK